LQLSWQVKAGLTHCRESERVQRDLLIAGWLSAAELTVCSLIHSDRQQVPGDFSRFNMSSGWWDMCLIEQDWESQPVAGVQQQTALLLAGQTQRMTYTAALANVSLRRKIKLRTVCCSYLQQGWKVCTWAASLELTGNVAAKLTNCSSSAELSWRAAIKRHVAKSTFWSAAIRLQGSWQCAAGLFACRLAVCIWADSVQPNTFRQTTGSAWLQQIQHVCPLCDGMYVLESKIGSLNQRLGFTCRLLGACWSKTNDAVLAIVSLRMNLR